MVMTAERPLPPPATGEGNYSRVSTEHVLPVALLLVVAVVLCVAARRAPGRWIDAVAAVIALTLVVAELSWQPYVVANRTWSAASSLPVQLCDVAGFVAAAALLWRQNLARRSGLLLGTGRNAPGGADPGPQ